MPRLRPRILGYRKNGAPIWSIAGASPDDPSNDDPPKGDEPKGDAPDEPKGDDPPPEGGDKPEDDSDDDWRKNLDPDKVSKRIAKLQSEAKNLRERTKSAEERAKDADGATKENATLKVANLRYEVALDLGLPKALVGRLQGGTKEELLTDAKALIDLVGTGKAPRAKPNEQLRGGGEPDDEPVEMDPDKLADRVVKARGY